MFEKLKKKLSLGRNSGTRRANRAKRNAGPVARMVNIVCWPFRAIARVLRRAWAIICRINLIGLINLTLLVAIIVLFTMLIIDITRCGKSGNINNVVISDAPSVAVVPDSVRRANRPQITVTNNPAPNSVRVTALPLRRDPINRKYINGTIRRDGTSDMVRRPTPQRFDGDVIIDRHDAMPVLARDVRINGDLYLQNMRKYILPCGAHINGNLFLRDVTMLQFCGDFTVTGNIYVSPRSSFGPIPRTARLGGQVIL